MEPTLERRTLLKAAGALTLVSVGATTSSKSTAAANRHRGGPMATARFTVEIDDVQVEGWQYVTIPSSSTEQGEYREGDDPDFEKKIWGQTTFDYLEMSRAIRPADSELYDWREDVRTGDLDDGRKEVTITLRDDEFEPQIRWVFEGTWLKEYDPPELNANADDDVATETATFSFDKMLATWDPGEELVIDIQADPVEPAFGEEVTFDGSESTPAEDIEEYNWEFDDGTTETGENVTHTVTSAGEYTVELTITRGVETETETLELDIPSPGLEYYTDDGVADEESTGEAFDHWEHGYIETDLLLDVINAKEGDESADNETG